MPALAKAEREDIIKLASYPEGTVGSVTSSDYLRVVLNMTVAEAISFIRENAMDKDTIYVIYVTDPENKLRGIISLKDLILAMEKDIIREIMSSDIIYVNAKSPREDAAKLIQEYDLLALPVVDDNMKMIGIVTVDDAMDIEQETNTTQLTKFGGIVSLGKTDDLDITTTSFLKMFKDRSFWLILLTFFGVFTSTFVAAQEELLSKVVVLAAFIAPIVDMGGNTGSQSATLVIRVMALGQVHIRWVDIWFIIKRKLPISIMLGITIGLLEIILVYFSKGLGIDILMVVGLSMITTTALGGIIGALLPFVAKSIGADPATLSAPIITSIIDFIGVFIYFGFAYLFLGRLILQE